MASITGGCLCGRVRYAISAEPLFCVVCHCRECQRFTGSAFVCVMRVPKDAVSVEGELKVVETPGSRGVIRRHFCPDCGSSVFGEPFRPGFINVVAGTLDDPSIAKPSVEIFCHSAFPWLHDGSTRELKQRGLS